MNHRTTVLLLLIVTVLFVTACGGGSQQALGDKSELAAQSEAVLTCSQECADNGWCGKTSDDRPVVLGNSLSPASPVHDRVYLQDTRVLINQTGLATMELINSGQLFELPFYHVTSLEQAKTAWIAGWCIAAP